MEGVKVQYRKKKRVNKELAKSLSNKVNLSPMITEFLCDKGYKDADSILKFINFKDQDLRKVTKMKDGLAFVKRLKEAVINDENIVIYGDYDADGISATTIFMKTLRWLGLKPNFFISNRFKEGYGLSINGITHLLETYPETDLIVTCDNGIVAFDAVDYLNNKGIDIIVSDHHMASPDGRLPDCLTVCEKRQDEDDDLCEEFCGAELARRLCFCLAAILGRLEGLKEEMDSLYAFSGFATVTDVIKFNRANHYIAKKGIEKINENTIPCFSAMKNVLEIKNDIDEETIGFKYGPMVNASGRITGEATLAVDLFLSDNIDDAIKYAEKLKALNELRQEKSFDEQQLAEKEYQAKNMKNDHFIVLNGIDGEYYDEGIAGLIASYIVDNYNKPCICLAKSEKEGVYKGSGRSVKGFNLKHALDKCSDLLIGYGGHPMAAGLSISEDNLDEFRKQINQVAKTIDDLVEYIDVDYLEKPNEFNYQMISEYHEYLAPFGPEFEKPVYATYGVFDDYEYTKILKDKHIKSTVAYEEGGIEVLWFNAVEKFNRLHPCNKEVLIVGSPSINEFKGNFTTQFIINKLKIMNDETAQ